MPSLFTARHTISLMLVLTAVWAPIRAEANCGPASASLHTRLEGDGLMLAHCPAAGLQTRSSIRVHVPALAEGLRDAWLVRHEVALQMGKSLHITGVAQYDPRIKASGWQASFHWQSENGQRLSLTAARSLSASFSGLAVTPDHHRVHAQFVQAF